MPILQVGHKVPDFDEWKKVFDKDPIDRKGSGVRRYRIYRPTDDPQYVIVDLEFDSAAQAESALAALSKLWKQVEGTVMSGPKARILDIVENKEY